MSSSTDHRIVVGRVGRPHGLHGEATVLPSTDDPDRFAPGSVLHADDGRELIVASSSQYRDRGLRVRFQGITDRRGAESLRGVVLTIDPDQRRSLEPGEFWEEDLIGLVAVTPDGERLGTVARLEYGPGQDRLVVVTADGGEVLVPFVSAFVGDPVDGTIEIDAPEGLFE